MKTILGSLLLVALCGGVLAEDDDRRRGERAERSTADLQGQLDANRPIAHRAQAVIEARKVALGEYDAPAQRREIITTLDKIDAIATQMANNSGLIAAASSATEETNKASNENRNLEITMAGLQQRASYLARAYGTGRALKAQVQQRLSNALAELEADLIRHKRFELTKEVQHLVLEAKLAQPEPPPPAKAVEIIKPSTYALKDGRKITVVKAQDFGTEWVLKDDKGALITVKKSDVETIEKP